MQELLTALEELRACGISKSGEAVSSTVVRMESITLRVEQWPERFVDGLLGLLQDQSFLDLQDSWKLVNFVNGNWEQLAQGQRERLRHSLATAFDRYGDWMGAFVTSEIFGERYADEDALATLADLGRTARLPARAAVPHGLETLAKTTPHELLRRLAIDRLRELEKSDSEQVREEVLISLKRLGQ